MKLFLTRSIGGSYKENGIRKPCALDDANSFLNLLREHWTINAKCLVLSSDPENEVVNDSFKALFTEAFRLSNFSLSQLDVCDRRNEEFLADTINDYDVLLVAGGHVPTQNLFFKKAHLKELMKNYKGIIIGISAGTMNCADVVYAQPEEGEATSQTYQRYLEGLSLTNINILPHFQDLKDLSVDGAFIFVEDHQVTLYGEAYWLQDGIVSQVCENDKCIKLF